MGPGPSSYSLLTTPSAATAAASSAVSGAVGGIAPAGLATEARPVTGSVTLVAGSVTGSESKTLPRPGSPAGLAPAPDGLSGQVADPVAVLIVERLADHRAVAPLHGRSRGSGRVLSENGTGGCENEAGHAGE